jgi:ribosomal protein S27E
MFKYYSEHNKVDTASAAHIARAASDKAVAPQTEICSEVIMLLEIKCRHCAAFQTKMDHCRKEVSCRIGDTFEPPKSAISVFCVS